MRVFIKEPGNTWELADVENTLDALQKAVGGYIETLTFCTEPDTLVLIMDEEGRLNGKQYNMTICEIPLFGTLLLCGKDRDEFTDVPDWAVSGMKRHKESAR